MDDAADLDAQVRNADPDRWLASRFVADAEARADLIALYAVNIELSRGAEVASQPLIGEIRLAWWREAIDEMFEGRPLRRHPAALGVAQAVDRRRLERARLQALVEGRMRDLDPWPLGPDEVEAYIDATAGAVMALAAQILSPGSDPGLVRHAARAWGLAGLWRLDRLPPEWTAQTVSVRIQDALDRAAIELRALPVAAFPAVAYAALARPYGGGRTPSELGRRARITWAVLRGRV